MIANGRRNLDRFGKNSEGVYDGVVIAAGGLPQMGFSLHRSNGRVDACFYHSLGDVELSSDDNGEYLTLTHGAKVITLRGRHLAPVVDALLSHTLVSLHQHDGTLPGDPNKPYIQEAWVTLLADHGEHEKKVKAASAA
jgi:hypothetical protein